MMNKKYIFLALLTISITIVAFWMFSNRRSDGKNGNLVAVSIYPLYDIVKNIAGPEINVEYVLPPGASPHTFDPSPQEVKKVAGRSILFMIGNGADNWAESFAKSANISRVTTVDKNITLINSHNHSHHSDDDPFHSDEEDENSGVGKDPHYWLSVYNAILIASQVRDELKAIYPEKSKYLDNNFKDYEIVLNNLILEIETEFEKLPNKKISTFHNAWNYFAKDHGIEVVTTFEEFPGEEPTIQYLQNFQKKIKEHDVKVIFSEPQFSSKLLEPIAKDLSVKIFTLDPIGGVANRNTYEDLIRYNVSNIKEALQ